MGLGNLEATESSSSSTRSRSSSKSSDSSSSSDDSDHPFPKHQRKCPEVVVTVSGDIRKYPETESIPFKKEWYSAPWEMDCARPQEWLEVWWSEQSWKLDCRVYEDFAGGDLEEDLKAQPDRTHEKLLSSRSEYTSGNNVREAQRYRSCGCCGTEIDIRYGDYEEVNNSVVCESHNVQELAANNLL